VKPPEGWRLPRQQTPVQPEGGFIVPALNKRFRYISLRAYRQAIEQGLLTPPEHCEICGQDNNGHPIEGHHIDYLRPYEVIWLCRTCHRKRHPENAARAYRSRSDEVIVITPSQAAADWLRKNNIKTVDTPQVDLATRISIEAGIPVSQSTLARVLADPEFASIQRETRSRKPQKRKRKG